MSPCNILFNENLVTKAADSILNPMIESKLAKHNWSWRSNQSEDRLMSSSRPAETACWAMSSSSSLARCWVLYSWVTSKSSFRSERRRGFAADIWQITRLKSSIFIPCLPRLSLSPPLSYMEVSNLPSRQQKSYDLLRTAEEEALLAAAVAASAKS